MILVNKVILVGRLGRDPEMKTSTKGPFANFALAVPEWKKPEAEEEPPPNWVNVICFGKTAEFVGEYLSKGKLVYVEGRVSESKWNDKDGNKRSRLEVIAYNVQDVDSRPPSAPSPQKPEPKPEPAPPILSKEGVDEADIPF